MATEAYVETAVFAAVRAAIESVPRQIVLVDPPPDEGYPEDEYGRWSVEPGGLREHQVVCNGGRIVLILRLTGTWSVSDMTPGGLGPMVRDVRLVHRAIQALGVVTTSAGQAAGWICGDPAWRPLQPICDIDLNVCIEYTGV